MASANDFLDYDLKAVTPVTRYEGDLRTVVDVVAPGSIVGKIYSWIVDANGNPWWMLYDTYLPGKSMYVKHDANSLKAIAPSGTVINVTAPGFLTDFATAASSSFTGIIVPILLVIGGIFLISRSK